MRDEIAAGIKNALERGETLNQAMQTFINAGYNPQEVMAAGKMFSEESATAVAYPQAKTEIKKTNENLSLPQLPKLPTEKKSVDKSKKIVIIAIIITLLVFFGALGYLLYLINYK